MWRSQARMLSLLATMLMANPQQDGLADPELHRGLDDDPRLSALSAVQSSVSVINGRAHRVW